MTEGLITDETIPNQEPGEGVPGYEDYWGTDEEVKHFLPDGVQYFVIKKMNEGGRAKFQRLTNQDLIVNRDQSARVKVDQARERHALITTAVTGWLLYKDGKPFGFDQSHLELWLSRANPAWVDKLEQAIRKANPWLQSEMKSSDIREEIVRMEELLREALEREAGEASSASK